MNWGVNRALEPLLVPTYMPLAIKGQEARREERPTAPLCPCQPISGTEEWEQEEWGKGGVGCLTQRSTGY